MGVLWCIGIFVILKSSYTQMALSRDLWVIAGTWHVSGFVPPIGDPFRPDFLRDPRPDFWSSSRAWLRQQICMNVNIVILSHNANTGSLALHAASIARLASIGILTSTSCVVPCARIPNGLLGPRHPAWGQARTGDRQPRAAYKSAIHSDIVRSQNHHPPKRSFKQVSTGTCKYYMSYMCWWSWGIRSELLCLFWCWCRCCLDDQGAWCQGGGHDTMLSSKQWPSWDETKLSDCFRNPSDDYPRALPPNDHDFGPIKVGEKFEAWPAGSGDPLRFDPIGPGGGVPDPDHMPVPGSIDIHRIHRYP